MSGRKRLLFLSPQSVVPLRHGAAIRIFQLARRLARGFEVTLLLPEGASATRAAAEKAGFPLEVLALEDHPSHRAGGLRRLAARFRGRLDRWRWRADPFGRVYAPLRRWYPLIEEVLAKRRPDVAILAHCWHLETFARLRRLRPGMDCLLDAHNVEATILERFGATLPGGGGRRMARHRDRVRGLESSLARYVDGFWACSATDHETLRRLNPGVAGGVVPNGVDTDYFRFEEAPRGAPEILFVGALGYEPAEEALLGFYRDIWPRLRIEVPDLRFSIVGRGATPRLRAQVGRDPSVSIAENVPDVRPYLRRAAVSICPLRAGSGTRLKILEAMSAGRPVVSTTVGAEGIEARPGAEIRIADDPGGFARATVGLLSDRVAYDAQRRRARALVEARYDWEAIGSGALAWIEERDAGPPADCQA